MYGLTSYMMPRRNYLFRPHSTVSRLSALRYIEKHEVLYLIAHIGHASLLSALNGNAISSKL